MSTIPTSISEKAFKTYIYPYLKVAQRGYESKIPLYKIFNYILQRLYTGCQWKELAIADAPDNPEKKRLVGKQCIIIGGNGMRRGTWRKCGKLALK